MIQSKILNVFNSSADKLNYYIYIYIYIYILVYSAIGAELLRIAGASKNPESFSTAIKPLTARMSRQGVSIGKINSSVLKNFNKHHSDFNNVCQSKQELLNLIS